MSPVRICCNPIGFMWARNRALHLGQSSSRPENESNLILAFWAWNAAPPIELVTDVLKSVIVSGAGVAELVAALVSDIVVMVVGS